MKTNDETDAAYMVRALRQNYEAAVRAFNDARIGSDAAFNALNIAEKAADYLAKLAAKAESK